MKFLLFLLLVGCANPKFPDPSQTVRNESSGASASCAARFNGSEHCVTIQWEREQTEREAGVFIFKVLRPNRLDSTLIPDDLPLRKVDLWMPDMSHGSAPITLERIDVGIWRASFVWFSMPGRWQIRFFGEGGNDAIVELVR